MATVVILHTNDIHGHLTPWQGWEGDLKGKTVGGLGRLAGAVAQIRKDAGEGVLLLDAGDLLGRLRRDRQTLRCPREEVSRIQAAGLIRSPLS